MFVDPQSELIDIRVDFGVTFVLTELNRTGGLINLAATGSPWSAF
jgi:uncharacterized membrane protein